MSTEFFSGGVWSEITKSVRASKLRVYVAVAFLGRGGSKQLPLRRGSVLVVNACDAVVKSGQTDPSELLKLHRRGTRVYSVDNLHAKVFVVGKCAYIGSTNVSSLSANHLVESVVRVTDPDAVRSARNFVEGLSLNELGPRQLKALKKIYNPPKFPGGARNKQGKEKKIRPHLPRVFVAQLHREDWGEDIEALVARGAPKAAKARKHPRTWIQDEFRWQGKCRLGKDDKVVQVTREPDGTFMVEEPATVLHVESATSKRGSMNSIVYVERPESRRRKLAAAARKFGCTQKQLGTHGAVRNQAIAQLLLKSW